MSDDKIKISWDELGSADNRPARQPTYTPQPQATSFSQPMHSPGHESIIQKRIVPLLLAGIVGVVLGVIFFICMSVAKGKDTPFHKQTVE